MPERIEVPPTLIGDERTQIRQIWNYLFTTVDTINRNLQGIGGNELTDRELASMREILQSTNYGMTTEETLKEMVVQTAEYVQREVGRFKESSLAEEVSSGRFGRYVNQTETNIPVDPAGNTAAQEIGNILNKLKADDIQVRNYCYTGVLRTENGTDIYGTAIGKNVVTYDSSGNETFVPENAVLEIIDGKITVYDGGEEMLKILTTAGGAEQTAEIRPGADADSLTYKGRFDGNLLSQETAETSCDDITEPASYWIDVEDVSDGPADLLTGVYMLEVMTTTDIVHQRISTGDTIYTRENRSGTWGSWNKFTGTAV